MWDGGCRGDAGIQIVAWPKVDVSDGRNGGPAAREESKRCWGGRVCEVCGCVSV